MCLYMFVYQIRAVDQHSSVVVAPPKVRDQLHVEEEREALAVTQGTKNFCYYWEGNVDTNALLYYFQYQQSARSSDVSVSWHSHQK